MTTNDIIRDSRVAHVRTLKAELARVTAARDAARQQVAAWEHHFALAVLAARDHDRLTGDGRIWALDGWNIVFNTPGPLHRDKAAFLDAVRVWAAAHPHDRVWVVFDGADACAMEEANVRISYTGGTGAHRADRLIADYARMLALIGRAGRLTVVTGDKDFAAAVRAHGAEVCASAVFLSR